jgi:hypothetical protein
VDCGLLRGFTSSIGSSDSSAGRSNAATISGPIIGNMNTSLRGWILNIDGAGLLSLSCSNNTADAPIFLANRMAEERNKRVVKVFYNRAQELCRSNSETIYARCGAGISASTFFFICPRGAAVYPILFCLRRFSTVSGGN